MKKLILPLVVILMGLAGGGAAGYFLSPEPHTEDTACVCEEGIDSHAEEAHFEEAVLSTEAVFDYVNLKNQFVVPVIEEEAMTGMVVMSLSLEVSPGSQEAVYNREPKLRDAFLRLLFAYATVGGFAGSYLEANDLKVIRSDLTKAAQDLLGPVVNEVLIVDLVRQGI